MVYIFWLLMALYGALLALTGHLMLAQVQALKELKKAIDEEYDSLKREGEEEWR